MWIKWVNDLYLNGLKVAGILCEAPRNLQNEVMGIIIGIGINVSVREFPEELRGKAGSLNRPDLDRNQLAASLTDRLMHWTEDLSNPELIAQYRRRSFLIGKNVSFAKRNRNIGKSPTSMRRQPDHGSRRDICPQLRRSIRSTPGNKNKPAYLFRWNGSPPAHASDSSSVFSLLSFSIRK